MACMHAIEPRGIAGGMCVFWLSMKIFFIEVMIEDGFSHIKL